MMEITDGAFCVGEFQIHKLRRRVMKRVPVFLLVLLLASTVYATQNKNAKPRKPKAAPVDCSTFTDAKITEDVKAKLAATKSLKDEAINVATSAGAVTLTGSVKKGIQKALATSQTKRVACVKKVENQITVEGAAASNKNARPRNSNRRKAANKNM